MINFKIPDSIPSFIDWYVKNSVSLGYKTGLIVLTIFIALVIDNLTGFTFYYQNKQRIEQVENIRQLKTKPGLDSIQISNLTSLQNEIINKKDFRQYLMGMLGASFNNTTSSNDKIAAIINSSIDKGGVKMRLDSFILSSSYVLLLMLFMTPLAAVWNTDGDVAAKLVFFVLVFTTVLLALGLNVYLMKLLVPPTPYAWLNHTLNVIVHGLCMRVFAIQYVTRKDKGAGNVDKK